MTDAGPAEAAREAERVRRIVLDVARCEPRDVRLLSTDDGLVVFITLGVDPDMTLADAHARASAVEVQLRAARPDIAEVIVHTEP